MAMIYRYHHSTDIGKPIPKSGYQNKPPIEENIKTKIDPEDLKTISNLYESALKEENWHIGRGLERKVELDNLLRVFKKYNIESNYARISNLAKGISRDSQKYSQLKLKIDGFKREIEMFEIKFKYTPDDELDDIESEWRTLRDQIDDLNIEARPIGERLVENREELRSILVDVLPQISEQPSSYSN